MFRPRHAYRSPITNRYRGKAKGCPVFNNLSEINSNMVEQHDECLECLAKIKNRTELYKTLADNNKPSNNVIKSLQRLSSSASNNRLKTCLQFLIIKVNEKSIATPKQTATTNGDRSPNSIQHDTKDSTTDYSHSGQTDVPVAQTTRNLTKRQKLQHNQLKQSLMQKQAKQNQLVSSPPQDQVSSTQDQVVVSQDNHDCQTSPLMLITTHIDGSPQNNSHKLADNGNSPFNSGGAESKQIFLKIQNQSSPQTEFHHGSLSTSSTTTASTTTTGTSPNHMTDHSDGGVTLICSEIETDKLNGDSKIFEKNNHSKNASNQADTLNSKTPLTTTTTAATTTSTTTTNTKLEPPSKRRRTQNSMTSEYETSSVASWSSTSFVASPSSSLSTASSTSSISESSSDESSSSSSSCSSSLSPSPSPLSSPDIINELKGPRLKLSEDKIRKIKKRPVLFDDIFCTSDQPSSASTPSAVSSFSPGQHSTTTQNSDQTCVSRNGLGGLASCNTVVHMFQAPPTFVNSLKPCNLPAPKQQELTPASTPPAPVAKVEMLNCAICGIKDKPPNISKVHGQNSCILCTKFFAVFLKRPQQLYCAQDGDCLMTFDSRCQACWIKICLQKFDIDEEHRKVGHKYSPKLLSSPNVSLITIDTSANT